MKRLHAAALALAVLIVMSAAPARAEGSFAMEDLLPILEEQPVIAQWVMDSLEFDESGYAMRIGNTVNPNLGGLRVAPYVILARPKGAEGPFTLEVTVETDFECLDASGNPTEFEQAVTLIEHFAYITVRPFIP